MKTIFVTGATGFVGSHAARLFLERGWGVRALVRRPDRPGLLPAGTDVVPGDLGAGGYREALAGCAAVLHVAGLTRARSLAEYLAVNERGTSVLVRLAAEACPEATFVLVSSQSAAGPSRNGVPVSERDAPRPVSWYGASKREGERAVENGWNGAWSIVRPSVVYGEGDPGMLQLFATVARGWAPILAGGARLIQLIGAGDLAQVLYSAATMPALAGRRGFAAGPPVAMGDLARFASSLRRPPARTFPLPSAAIRAAGWVESFREALTGRCRPFNRDKAREILQPGWVCDARPFLRDAGIVSIEPWREGVKKTIAWYVREGWLPPAFGEL